MAQRDYMPTDIMHRRVPLPLSRCFVLFGTAVLIATNFELLLTTAEMAGFAPSTDTNISPDMRWEIVGSPASSSATDWKCQVLLGDHSLYLSMGSEQWFAFDLETHHGAGFVAICDSDPNHETNARRYLSLIARHVGASLPAKLVRSRL